MPLYMTMMRVDTAPEGVQVELRREDGGGPDRQDIGIGRILLVRLPGGIGALVAARQGRQDQDPGACGFAPARSYARSFSDA